MIEITGDLWATTAPVICITTNGDVKRNGECVMGRGVALQAKQKWPDIAMALGRNIRNHGNFTRVIGEYDNKIIVGLPVKYHWSDHADLKLIIESIRILRTLTNLNRWAFVALPRPGCGNGGLLWKYVKPAIDAEHLDDRFIIIERNPR